MIALPRGWDLGDELIAGIEAAHIQQIIDETARTAPLRGPYFDVLTRSIGDPITLPMGVLPGWQDVLALSAQAKQVPVDYVVHHLFGAAGGMLAGMLDIQVRPGWIEPSVLFAVNIGDAGSGKSPATDVIDLGLRAVENDYREAHRQAVDAWKMAADLSEEDPGPKPLLQRVRVQDITPEAAGVQLARQERGLILWQTELSEFVAALTRYQRQSRGFFLRAYDAHPGVVDRRSMNDEPLIIPRLALSMVAGIQPQPLSDFVKEIRP